MAKSRVSITVGRGVATRGVWGVFRLVFFLVSLFFHDPFLCYLNVYSNLFQRKKRRRNSEIREKKRRTPED